MRRIYDADAGGAPPAVPAAPSAGYPSLGDPANNVDATLLGAFWVYMVTEGFVSVIEQAGLTLDDQPTQFRDALLSLFPGAPDLTAYATEAWVQALTATTGRRGIVELSTIPEALAGASSTRAVTPAGVRAVRDALVGGSPGMLDVLAELAAAIGDDPNFSATIMAALALRARLDGAVFTGDVDFPTAAIADDSTQGASTEWVRRHLASLPIPVRLAAIDADGVSITGDDTGTLVNLSGSIVNFSFIELMAKSSGVTYPSWNTIRFRRESAGATRPLALTLSTALDRNSSLDLTIWFPTNTTMRLQRSGVGVDDATLYDVLGMP